MRSDLEIGLLGMRGVDARFIIIDFISNTQIVLASR